MNIQSEIRDYIFSHDFVMLPGIGAFVAEYSQPYFDKEGEIVPSERKIRFNSLLRNDSDVDILQVFKERMQISDQEVQDQYFTFLDNVNAQLSTFNRYYWEGFGILLKEAPGGELQFLPFRPTEGAAVTETPQPAAYPDPVEVPPAEDEYVSEMADRELSEEDLEEKGDFAEEVPGGGKALKYLVFALPLALLSAALVYMVFFKPSLRNSVKEEAIALESDLMNSGEVTIDTLYADDPVYGQSVAPDTAVLAEEHVVRVGIYKRMKDAEKIVFFLAGKGYEAKIRPHGPLFKVYLLAPTEDTALRYIKEVERLIDDTPIYERKKGNG